MPHPGFELKASFYRLEGEAEVPVQVPGPFNVVPFWILYCIYICMYMYMFVGIYICKS